MFSRDISDVFEGHLRFKMPNHGGRIRDVSDPSRMCSRDICDPKCPITGVGFGASRTHPGCVRDTFAIQNAPSRGSDLRGFGGLQDHKTVDYCHDYGFGVIIFVILKIDTLIWASVRGKQCAAQTKPRPGRAGLAEWSNAVASAAALGKSWVQFPGLRSRSEPRRAYLGS